MTASAVTLPLAWTIDANGLYRASALAPFQVTDPP
jgi:hypothetical protein